MNTKVWFFLGCFIFFINAAYSQNQADVFFKGYYYVQTHPTYNKLGEITGYKTDTIRQFFFDSTVVILAEQNIRKSLNGQLAFEESVMQYFFYDKGNSKGIKYDFHGPEIRKKTDVDSFLSATWINNFEMSIILDTSVFKLEREEKDAVNNRIYYFKSSKSGKPAPNIEIVLTVRNKEKDFMGSMSNVWDKQYKGIVSNIRITISQPTNNNKNGISYYINYSLEKANSYPANILVMLDDYERVIGLK